MPFGELLDGGVQQRAARLVGLRLSLRSAACGGGYRFAVTGAHRAILRQWCGCTQLIEAYSWSYTHEAPRVPTTAPLTSRRHIRTRPLDRRLRAILGAHPLAAPHEPGRRDRRGQHGVLAVDERVEP